MGAAERGVSAGVRHIVVGAQEADMRLDRWFREHYPALTHGRLEKILRKGLVRIDGGRCKNNTRLAEGQTIRVPPEVSDAPTRNPQIDSALARELESAIVFRDAQFLALNKPSGLAVQGGSKTHRHIDKALPALKFEAEATPRLVHRLDRDTSGVLLLGRDRQAAQFLTRAFAHRKARKTYWALVYGVPKPQTGVIDFALAKTQNGVRVAEGDNAKRARTDYAVLARAGTRFAWVAFRPVTGRTHQIRAHIAAIGHPIVGDVKFRPEEPPAPIEGIADRLHLHARTIWIPHPKQGIMEISAPLTGHMLASWGYFGWDKETELLEQDPFEEAQ